MKHIRRNGEAAALLLSTGKEEHSPITLMEISTDILVKF
jgi:hypothetical protein